MNLFGINYNKEGPGVEKNAPPQKTVVRFFAIFGRKFTDLIKLNLLFCIPVVLAAALSYGAGLLLGNSYLAALPLILISPFVGGITFVTRNYAREEHAFLFSDFMDSVKNNWKAFLVNGVVFYAVVFLLDLAIRYYSTRYFENPIFFLPLAVCCGIGVLFLFGQYYVPVMIVMFDLNLLQIYKNSFIFALAGLWRNILLTAILAFLWFLLYCSQIMPLTLIIGILLVLLLYFSLSFFLINFTVYPLIVKYLVRPDDEKKR